MKGINLPDLFADCQRIVGIFGLAKYEFELTRSSKLAPCPASFGAHRIF
jgi:hypothetical protein